MATSRLDQLTRSASMYLSRRTLAGALGLGALALPIGSEARKKRKKKVKRNGFGCVNVGGYCKNGGQCCSGICQGKKGKKKCQAHNTLGCQPGNLLTDCGGQNVDCPDYGEGGCTTTTGKAAFCYQWKFNLPSPCRRDADCKTEGFKAACVLCGNSTTCALF